MCPKSRPYWKPMKPSRPLLLRRSFLKPPMFKGWSGPSSVVALKNLIAGMQQEIQERFSGMADNPDVSMIRRMVDAAANSAEAYFRELTDHLVSEIYRFPPNVQGRFTRTIRSYSGY